MCVVGLCGWFFGRLEFCQGAASDISWSSIATLSTPGGSGTLGRIYQIGGYSRALRAIKIVCLFVSVFVGVVGVVSDLILLG